MASSSSGVWSPARTRQGGDRQSRHLDGISGLSTPPDKVSKWPKERPTPERSRVFGAVPLCSAQLRVFHHRLLRSCFGSACSRSRERKPLDFIDQGRGPQILSMQNPHPY